MLRAEAARRGAMPGATEAVLDRGGKRGLYGLKGGEGRAEHRSVQYRADISECLGSPSLRHAALAEASPLKWFGAPGAS